MSNSVENHIQINALNQITKTKNAQKLGEYSIGYLYLTQQNRNYNVEPFNNQMKKIAFKELRRNLMGRFASRTNAVGLPQKVRNHNHGSHEYFCL